jgi:hypothetical protein
VVWEGPGDRRVTVFIFHPRMDGRWAWMRA